MKNLLLVILLLSVMSAFSEWKVDEGFETGEIPSNWRVIDGQEGATWTAYENDAVAHSGNWMAFSESYTGGQDNWLILPQTEIETGDVVTMYIRSWYSTEDFEIRVSVSSNDPDDFDDELISVEGQENDYTEYSFDLSEYAGQSIYVGINWISDTYALLVDDVSLGQSGAINTPPSINLPSELTFEENGSLEVDFSQYVNDPEGDELTLSYSDNDEVNVAIDGLAVIFSAPQNWFGDDTMLFYVSDGQYSDSDFLTVVVTEEPDNSAPEIDLPSEFTFEENGSLEVDFSQYVSDPEGDELTLSCSDNNEVMVDIQGLNVNFSAEPDWFGDDVMLFYVSDGEFTDSDFLTVVVTEQPGNSAPVIDLPDEFTFMENNTLTVDFEEYVYDADDDILSLSVSSNNEITVDIDQLMVSFSAPADWSGEDVMMFEVSDGLESATDFLTVIVTESPEPGWTISEDFETGAIADDWTIIAGDEGSSWMAYQNSDVAHSGSWMAFSESYTSGQDNWLITPLAWINAGDEFSFYARSWYSTEDLEVLISLEDNVINDFDYELGIEEGIENVYSQYTYDLSEYAGQEVYIAIHWICDTYALLVDDIMLGQDPDANHPPEIDLPESISFDEDTSCDLDISAYAFDPDGDELVVNVSGNVDIQVAVSGMIISFSAPLDWYGQETITISVSDGELIASDDILVIVNDIADHLYGDVDDGGIVDSFDASLILQYVVGFDPAPYAPLPWEDWRLEIADVDDSGSVGAYDAALILQYVVGIINELPWNAGGRRGGLVKAVKQDNQLILKLSEEVYSLYAELPAGGRLEPAGLDMVVFYNVTNGKTALASANGLQEQNLVYDYLSSENLADLNNLELEINGINHNIEILDYQANEDIIETSLEGNYPNPFNPSTAIRFNVAENEKGYLSIYNVRGELVEKEEFCSGKHTYEWQADEYSSGIYFYKLQTKNVIILKKMTLLK